MAKERREDWEALLLNGSHGKALGTPDFIKGDSPQVKAKNYAALLTDRFHTEYPTTAFAGSLERALHDKEKSALIAGLSGL